MADATNPSNVWGPNEYAGFVAPKRADASTVGPGGNIVDKNRIPKTMNTADKNNNQAHPLGNPGTTGY